MSVGLFGVSQGSLQSHMSLLGARTVTCIELMQELGVVLICRGLCGFLLQNTYRIHHEDRSIEP